MFKGLFIGIDRYASPRINWLSCARRDAAALQTLFADNLGGESLLLVDADATRPAISSAFDSLAQCSADDVVFIAFSGHGSQTHELVTYDSDIDRLADTAIPLELLTQWFSRIPARRLICALDCCFSGGFGAKVLRVDALPRQLQSEDELLNRISGEGRLILTASTANQPAWEISRRGHGLLTYFLLEAFQGAEEVRQAGNVSTYRLLEYVTQRVTNSAAQFGKEQHPTLRGQLDGQLTWPIFTPGPLFRSAFPEYRPAEVTSDLASLAAAGFPDALIAAWKQSIPSLNALQVSAINDFKILNGDHVVISAPTSSGKTMIGELAAVKSCLARRRAAFLLPLKALVNDKYRYFTDTYGTFGFRVIRATGDIVDDIPSLMRGQYDICLLTYEKFASIVLGNPHILDQLGTIVIDEAQMIADSSRGVNLEFLLTLIRMRRQQGIEPQLIALSAVIGETNGFDQWLGARLLRRTERPVPLNEGVLSADGSYQYVAANGAEQLAAHFAQREWRKNSSQDLIIPLVRRLVSEGMQVIVFREIKGEARGCAEYLANALGLPPASEALDLLSVADPSFATTQLQVCLRGGVGFHIADLDPEERRVIEEQFRKPNSTIRVLAATTTLAMGINTPAEAVVIAGLTHPGDQPYSIAEYKNMAGRAGRLGFASEGNSFLIALTGNDQHHFWNHYVRGTPENLESRFVTSGDPRSLVLRVLAAAQRTAHAGVPINDIAGFLEGSFGAFRHVQTHGIPPWSHGEILKALGNLKDHNLVEETDDQHFQLTQLGRFAGESGVEVESIVRLVEAIRQLHSTQLTDPTLIALAQLTVELDAVFFPFNRRSTQKEPFAWQNELRNQGVPNSVLQCFHRHIRVAEEATARAKRAAACLLWITEQPLSEIERVLTQFGGAFGGVAGPIRAVSSRARDLLPAVVHVAKMLHPDSKCDENCTRLLVRLELGLPGRAVDLASYAGSSLARGDYLQLAKANLCTLQDIDAAPDEQLLACVGKDKSKLSIVRTAAKAYQQEGPKELTAPILPPYQS